MAASDAHPDPAERFWEVRVQMDGQQWLLRRHLRQMLLRSFLWYEFGADLDALDGA